MPVHVADVRWCSTGRLDAYLLSVCSPVTSALQSVANFLHAWPICGQADVIDIVRCALSLHLLRPCVGFPMQTMTASDVPVAAVHSL